MAKLSAVCLVFLTLGCAWSYYYQSYPQHPPQNVIYRHHFPAYHPPTPYVNQVPVAPAINHAPVATNINPVPLSPSFHSSYPQQMQFGKVPMNYGYPSHSQRSPYPQPYNPVAFHNNYYTPPHQAYPLPPRTYHHAPYSYHSSYSSNSPKQTFFNKIKPFLFGGNTSPKSVPHHPYFPTQHHPHMYYPTKGFHNSQPQHHVHHQQHHHQMHHMHGMQQHSCSCSLHVGQLTVYKHIDMRASYSCHDLKDCNSFCTNLFSSEDLRAQTRADACLMLGKDGSVPWFRRDQVCGHHGLYNDTKLSVDLCCKDLQPC